MTFADLVNQVAINGIVQPLIGLGIVLALFFFIWGLVRLIRESGNKADHEKARNQIFWGIIALAVMVSVWGLVNFAVEAVFPEGPPKPPDPPALQIGG